MKTLTSRVRHTIAGAFILTAVAASAATAQSTAERSYDPVRFDKMNLEGPRFGVTYVTGDGELAQRLDDEGMGRVLSQFGWHFERKVIPEGGGPQFVIEGVPLLAGVEYGTLIPSMTLAMGVRFPDGWEFGLGPNVVLTDDTGPDPVTTSLVVAGGYSFQYGGVNLPVNLTYATNPEGGRVSVVLGYAIRKKVELAG